MYSLLEVFRAAFSLRTRIRVSSVIAFFCLWCAISRAAEIEAPDVSAMQEIAKMGEGFLVWERALHGDKGDWQIWTRPLDPNGKEALLVPAEDGWDHYCPKLSPDGSKLAYMSYKRGKDAYNRKSVGVLWVMDLATRKLVQLAPVAKSYQEDRAVSWFDNTRLCYLDGKGETNELDILTGKSKRLITEAKGKYGFLVNSNRTFATSGDPEFAPFESNTGIVENQAHLDGCQPYFSQDGKWGFWMSGVGGPISRFYLPLRESSPIIARKDPRLPPGRGYIYFPMLSPCMRLFAFAASPDQHDHFTANYNLFVSRIDPETLELTGKPARYTWFKGTDRYPDIFAEPLPLGSHYTEGPAPLKFTSPTGKSCAWRVDGHDTGIGTSFSHTFADEGEHWVEAECGGKVCRGYVWIRHSVPPSILSVKRGEAKTLVITFNKPVSLRHAKVMAGKVELGWKGQFADDRVASVQLPERYVSLGEIAVSGVEDKAPTPHELPPTRANFNLSAWPPFHDDLVFGWENHQANPLDPKDTIAPEPHGRAYWDQVGAMGARGGAYELPEAGDRIMRDCGRSHAFTAEMILLPRSSPVGREALPILTLENSAGEVKFALLQRHEGFAMFLATEQKNQRMDGEELLAPAIVDETQHVVVTYDKGVIGVVVNGVARPVASKIHGRPAFVRGSGVLRVGGAGREYPDVSWRGSVDHLAFYSRALSTADAMALFDYAAPKIAERSTIKPLQVVARLVETSRLPSLEEIKPYHEALVKNLYEVLPNGAARDKGSALVGHKIIVTHWVWINGEPAKAPPAETAKSFGLLLEPLSTHPEVRSLVTKDDLADAIGFDEYLDVSNR